MGLSCRSKAAIAVCNSSSESKKKCSSILQEFKFKDLEAATGGFAPENLIMKASHGLIFRGVLGDGRVVAVKLPTPGPRLWQDEDAFENEMQVLSKPFSRRLVNLLGHSQDRARLLVVEYMAHGSLHDHLHSTIGRAASLTWPLRVHLALQVAKAIRGLHASSPPIVHRNIRAMNVFIDRDWNARLGDFGLARCAQDTDPPRRCSNLSSIPEESARFSDSFDENPSHISTKGDVFNFGMLLLEIMSGRSAVSLDADFTPFILLDWALPLIKNGNAMAICDARLEPPQVTAAVKRMATIAVRCVRASGSRRPSMDDIVDGLKNVSKLLPMPMWSGLTTRVRTTLRQEDHPAVCKANRLIRLPLWTGFLRLKKRKRALVFGLGKILAGKLRFGTVRYTRLPSNESRRSCSAARVSDQHVIDQHQLQAKEKPRKAGYHPHWSSSSGKHSARVVQMGNIHERAAVRGL